MKKNNNNLNGMSLHWFVWSKSHTKILLISKNYCSRNETQKLIDETLGNKDFTGWVPSLTHSSMNVHYQVTQLLSKANTVHMRVTSNGENVPRGGEVTASGGNNAI